MQQRKHSQPTPTKLKVTIAKKSKLLSAKWKKALVVQDSEAGARRIEKLQSAVAALDEITKPLADFLMDKANGSHAEKARVDTDKSPSG